MTHAKPDPIIPPKQVSDPVPPAQDSLHWCTYCKAHMIDTAAVMGFVVPTPDHGDVQINLCGHHLAEAVRDLTASLKAIRPTTTSRLVLPGLLGPKTRN